MLTNTALLENASGGSAMKDKRMWLKDVMSLGIHGIMHNF